MTESGVIIVFLVLTRDFYMMSIKYENYLNKLLPCSLDQHPKATSPAAIRGAVFAAFSLRKIRDAYGSPRASYC